MVKRLTLWASACLFLSSTTLLIISLVSSLLLTSGHFKSWAGESGVYTQLQKTILAQATERQKTQNPNGLSLQDKNVGQAAQKALSESFIQKSSEQIIDAHFAWLNNQTEQPVYSIDSMSVKENFADTYLTTVRERYQQLPVCATGGIPSSADPLKIDCRPSDELYDLEAALQTQRLSILNDESFLPNSAITPDSLGVVLNQPMAPDYQSNVLPNIYNWLHKIPYIFASLMLLSGVMVVALCKSKKFGVRKLGWRLIVAGLLVLLAVGLTYVGILQLQQVIDSQTTKSVIYPYKSILTDLVSASGFDAIIYSAAAAGISIILGGITLYLTRDVSNKLAKENSDSSEQTTDPEEDKKEEAKKNAILKMKEAAKEQSVTPTKTATEPTPTQVKPQNPPKPSRPPLIQ